jgi:hypothetical protein
MQKPDNYDFEEHTPVISKVIEDQDYLPQFQAVMEEEVTILYNIDHPDYEQDYEDIGILKLCRNYIITPQISSTTSKKTSQTSTPSNLIITQ